MLHRDIGERVVATNMDRDHDTIAIFRYANEVIFAAAFPLVRLVARETGLLRSAQCRSRRQDRRGRFEDPFDAL